MNEFIILWILIPFVGFVLSLLMPKTREDLVSGVASWATGLHLIGLLIFTVLWAYNGFESLNDKDWVLFKSNTYEFYVDFCFDKVTAVFALVGAFLNFLIVIYSRVYLHREPGYKRFFNTILLFMLGYNLAIFAGNMETLFAGWEVLGISSFLLIAYYRDRFLPVKNALKVFSIYRIGDIGLILATWMSHHLFHESLTFMQLENYQLVSSELQSHTMVGIFISAMILLTASAKSAQVPFSSWLPRAMEGPTTSSAIFYGSLAVHLGVFLLLRTFPFWEHQFSVRVLIFMVGLSSATIATFTSRVQSNIKSQIAYASIAQIGLMFIELSFGWSNIALFHFAANAFLRTYQLLVSPSVVSYLIKEMFFSFEPPKVALKRVFAKKIMYSLYVMNLKEWNLNTMMYKVYWNPVKWLGKRVNFITMQHVIYFFIPAFVTGVFLRYHIDWLPEEFAHFLPVLFSFIGLIMVLKAYSERSKAAISWVLIILNHLWIALAISFNEQFKFVETGIYLSGVLLAGVTGYFTILRLRKIETNIDLTRFNGHVYSHPKLALVFLISCLALSGFPITPTFIGEDLVFSHIHSNQYALAFFVSAGFIMDGLAILRIYARVFLGPHIHSVYEMGYRSS
ncbi:MAG: proton-conducting transporter membrane subunit [bacterium]|nr:proton-conducting transporter membrane subunit [bacterium]